MIPRAPESLGHMALRIATDLIPKATDDYSGADLGLMTVMLSMVGQDFERFAELQVSEHDQMSDLFRQALPHLEGDLASRVKTELDAAPSSLLASSLNDRADRTTRLLIDLHAFVEDRIDADWARQLNPDIWTFLDLQARRRAYDVTF